MERKLWKTYRWTMPSYAAVELSRLSSEALDLVEPDYSKTRRYPENLQKNINENLIQTQRPNHRTFGTPGLGSGGDLGASESPSTMFTKQYSINAMNTNLPTIFTLHLITEYPIIYFFSLKKLTLCRRT